MNLKIKKSILITIVALTVLAIALSIGVYFAYDSYKNTWNENSGSNELYNQLLEECTSKKEGSVLNVLCKGFIESVKKDDNTLCFDLILVSESYDLKETTICEKESNIVWDESTMVSELKIPVNLTLVFKERQLKNYKLVNAKFDLMSDNEASSLSWNIWSKTGEDMIGVYFSETRSIEKDKYIVRSLSDKGAPNLNFVYFTNAVIRGVDIKDDDILLDVELEIEDKTVNLEIRTKKVDYVSLFDESNSIITNKEALSSIKLESVHLRFYYFDSQPSEDFCIGEPSDPYVNIFCVLNDSIYDLPVMDMTIYQYLSTVAQGKIDNLERLILGEIISYDN